MKNLYFIKQTLSNELNAGPKAKVDTYKTLERLGYKPIIYVSDAEKRMPRYLQGLRIVLKLVILKNSVVFMENPIKNWRFITMANYVMRSRNNKLVLLIHDIESERYEFPKHIEYKFLNSFDAIIAHNTSMKAFLEKQLNKKIDIFTLNIFDYLLDPNFQLKPSLRGNYIDTKTLKWEIIYCGNLARNKSSFLYRLNAVNPINWNLNLYGVGIDDISKISFIKFNGSFQPNQPDISANSDFGLIWDGGSVDKCDGITGIYMKLNNPHKLSLYIALNLPVIVWKEAAVAKIVEENHLGFTINKLSEIDEVLSALTIKEYDEFRNNLQAFRKKVTSGGYLTSALAEIL